MAQEAGFIKYVIIIGIILVVVFLSQQGNIKEWVKNSTVGATEPTQQYLQNSTNWAKDTILPTLAGEVEKRGEMVQEGVNEETKKISESVKQTVTEKIKNYISGVTNSVLHPGEPQNCSCPDQASNQP